MNTRKFVAATVFALCLSPLSTAIGGDVYVDSLPAVQTQNGVNYLSGGIGLDESQAIAAAAKDYSLMLTFATLKSGKYLADIHVKIEDKNGALVLDAVADGPMLLVQLPSGQYKISAASNDRQVTKTVSISGNRTTKETLYWPDDAAE
jgi:hypothetical protein